MNNRKYILITPAKNEDKYIEETINSILAQANLPYKWFIVNDASTDNTSDIIHKHSKEHDFISPIDNKSKVGRNFASKVHAVNLAIDQIRMNDIDYDFIGILDADTKLDPEYYEMILHEFDKDEQLGMAGGYFFEYYKGKKTAVILDENSVRGAVQFFRKQCFEDIGGFVPLEEGGEDIITEITARMKGWKVRSFKHIEVTNLRISGVEAWGLLEAKFREGIREHSVGYNAVFQMAKSIYRIKERPYIIAGVLHFWGYLWAVISNNKIKVSDEFRAYLKREQLGRLFPFLYKTK